METPIKSCVDFEREDFSAAVVPSPELIAWARKCAQALVTVKALQAVRPDVAAAYQVVALELGSPVVRAWISGLSAHALFASGGLLIGNL